MGLTPKGGTLGSRPEWWINMLSEFLTDFRMWIFLSLCDYQQREPQKATGAREHTFDDDQNICTCSVLLLF